MGEGQKFQRQHFFFSHMLEKKERASAQMARNLEKEIQTLQKSNLESLDKKMNELREMKNTYAKMEEKVTSLASDNKLLKQKNCQRSEHPIAEVNPIQVCRIKCILLLFYTSCTVGC